MLLFVFFEPNFGTKNHEVFFSNFEGQQERDGYSNFQK